VGFICDFEASVVHCVGGRGVAGVICGHIHAAAIKGMGGIRYLNCGDWVDNCTAIVEHEDGRMELVEWGVARPAAPPPALEARPGSTGAEPYLAAQVSRRKVGQRTATGNPGRSTPQGADAVAGWV
jgi:hypothetical protein